MSILAPAPGPTVLFLDWAGQLQHPIPAFPQLGQPAFDMPVVTSAVVTSGGPQGQGYFESSALHGYHLISGRTEALGPELYRLPATPGQAIDIGGQIMHSGGLTNDIAWYWVWYSGSYNAWSALTGKLRDPLISAPTWEAFASSITPPANATAFDLIIGSRVRVTDLRIVLPR